MGPGHHGMDDEGSIDEGELMKSESEQFKLLADVQEVFQILEEQGIDFRTATLDSTTLGVIAAAEDMIHRCIMA